MRLEHSFEVPVPVERAWEVLGDLETIVPCMPGAALTSYDGDAFTGTVRVKIGPVSLSLKGKGHFTERDEQARKLAFTASGQDSKGAGAANATVVAQLNPTDAGTRVDVVTDLNISGRMAQIGRNMIGDVSGKLLDQFVGCLSGKLTEPAPAATAPSDVPTGTPDATAAADAPAEPATDAVSTVDAAASPAGDAPSASGTGAGKPAEPEPVDLLALAGGGMARRVVPWAVGAVVAIALIVILIISLA
ncbi:SRPBCC family protein [Luedemannella helvata]|uniref:Carbon monoxide dehydrogenase subunit G n=1 Tax=Luedemannella helvata TaxID=349315 RepID=A0ABN2JWQ2_9ACTN